jgi:hypothetical protein
MKKAFMGVFLAGLWITLSEFVRNEFLLKGYWVNHYSSMGLSFKTLPLNGIFWMLWSFLLAYLLFKMIPKFSWVETIFLAWIAAFLMMWITLFNMKVLPLGLLVLGVPLSLLEIIVAGYIIKKFK